MTDWTKYKFYNSPFFVPELNNWHIKDDAPEEIKIEFKDAMKKYTESFGNSSNELTEEEKDILLQGIDPNAPLMSTEEFINMMIKVFINQGKTYDEAKKIVEDKCKEYGIN